MTYSIIIPEDLDKDLTIFAKQKDRHKSYLIREAIAHYIQRLKDDQEDLQDALNAMQNNESNISWQELQRRNGLLED